MSLLPSLTTTVTCSHRHPPRYTRPSPPCSLNMIHTLSLVELEKTYNSRDPDLLNKRFFSRPGDAALLPLVELPPAVVEAVLRHRQDPLGELIYKCILFDHKMPSF